METRGPWHRLGAGLRGRRPGSGLPGATSWGETGLGGAEPRVGHVSNSCLFGAVSQTHFILLVLTFHEATAGGGAERQSNKCAGSSFGPFSNFL